MDRKKFLYIGCAVGCLLFASFVLHNADNIFGRFSKEEDVVEESIEAPKEGTAETERPTQREASAEAEEGECVVYVIGAVKHPGVYTVPNGTRVYKLLSLAGGFSEDADKAAVNLAAKVKDGEEINFPSCVETAQKGYRASGSSSRKSSSAKSSDDTRQSESSSTRRTRRNANGSGAIVNINSASEEELDSLPGVGAKTAALIVEYRRQHGRFERKEDLLSVRGIGAKKYEKLKDHVTVGE